MKAQVGVKNRVQIRIRDLFAAYQRRTKARVDKGICQLKHHGRHGDQAESFRSQKTRQKQHKQCAGTPSEEQTGQVP
jgi:hypothetical protein